MAWAKVTEFKELKLRDWVKMRWGITKPHQRSTVFVGVVCYLGKFNGTATVQLKNHLPAHGRFSFDFHDVFNGRLWVRR